MIGELFDHLEEQFGSQALMDLIVNATLINRGVDLAFRDASPELKGYAGGLKILLQVIYARQYRERNWKQIAIQHVTQKGVNLMVPRHFAPELKGLAVQAVTNFTSDYS